MSTKGRQAVSNVCTEGYSFIETENAANYPSAGPLLDRPNDAVDRLTQVLANLPVTDEEWGEIAEEPYG